MTLRLSVGSLVLTLGTMFVVVLCEASVDGDWQRGLQRLAVERAWRAAAPMALGGAAGAVLSLALAALLRRLAPDRSGSAVAGGLLALAAAGPLLVAVWLGGHARLLLAPAPTAALLAIAAIGMATVYRYGTRPGPRTVAVRMLAVVVVASSVVAGGAWLRVQASSNAPGGPPVVLILMDTVRADRLSTYGYPRPTTPELDAFAREAIRFERFYSTSCWTLPGHASLFTGLYPAQHGATQEHLRLDRGAVTLAEILRNAGYRTFGASANPVVGPISGLDQGFHEFRDVWREPVDPFVPRNEHPVNAALADFLARTPGDEPFFVFLNYMEAHLPYQPPPALVRQVAGRRVNPLRAQRVGGRKWYEHFLPGPYTPRDLALMSDLYDAELARLSRALGESLDLLRRDGRYDEALIVVTSDHGENLGDHGLVDHVFSLYETTLHIPLLVRLPRGARGGTVDPRLAQLVDLFPAILQQSGVDPAVLPNEGIDVFDGAHGRRQIVAEYYYPEMNLALISAADQERHAERLAPYRRRLRAIQRDGRKLIWGSDGRHEIYDLTVDPNEATNLAAEGEAGPLLEALDRAMIDLGAEERGARAPSAEGLGNDADRTTRDALRALGYAE